MQRDFNSSTTAGNIKIMSKTLKWIIFSVIGVIAIIIIAKLTADKNSDAIKVTAETVKRRAIIETVTASGRIYPGTEIKVGSPIAGEVVELNVQEGDTVTKGQVLARIQGDKSGGSTPRISIPNVPPGFESLVQGMQTQPRSTASSATIVAPMSGTVLGLNIKQGERIGSMQMPGSELMRIADMKHIEVRVDVNENSIIKVTVGDSADVEVDAYNKRKFKGLVTSIGSGSSKKDVQSMMSADITAYEVHIQLVPSSYADLIDTSKRRRMAFRPNMNARAEIKTQRHENVLSVPVGAVTSRMKGSDDTMEDKKAENKETDNNNNDVELEEVVYVIKTDGTVEKKVVTTGIQDINHFEILTGLKDGDEVVTGPNTAVSTSLKTGKKIKKVKKEELFQNK
jgi:multidrug efflux pump subunit AcrA (membrane-fusion protein)